MKALLRHHARSFAQTVRRMAGAPLATLANTVVIGVVLALPLGAYGLLINLQAFSGAIPTEPQISLFLSPRATRQEASAIGARLRKTAGVRQVRFVSRDEALAGLKRTPGLSEIIGSLKDNPLPDAFIATLTAPDPALSARLEQQFRALPAVEHVQADSAWLRRVDALLNLGRNAVALLGGLLGFALVAVTFNTIRLQVLTQREEIEISKLIGATDGFIQLPFFYQGSLLGALGALGGLGVVAAAFSLMNANLTDFGLFYGAVPVLRFLTWQDALSVVTFGAGLGFMGSYLSVSRYLHKIEVR